MQPTYLPWSGYINLIKSVDVFVFLDDVQFARKTWQSKNRVKIGNKTISIEVPVERAPLQTPISDIRIDNQKAWAQRHIKTLTQAYEHAPFFDILEKSVFEVLLRPHIHLAELNIGLIIAICDVLGLEPNFVRATDLACAGSRSDHVAEICSCLGATHYLSPLGSREYLEEDRFEQRFPLTLEFQSYEPGPYQHHTGGAFISHLSIVDVIAELGPSKAAEYV